MRRRRRRTTRTTGENGGRDVNETGAIERQRAELLRLSVTESAMTAAAAAAAETCPEKVNDKESNQIKTVLGFWLMKNRRTYTRNTILSITNNN